MPIAPTGPRSKPRFTLSAIQPSGRTSPRSLRSSRPNADRAEIDRLSRAHHALLDPALLPWSERSIPRIKVSSIRWVTPEVAVVVAADTQFGSTGSHAVALFFVMKKQAAAWKIAAVRVEAGA